MSFKDLLIIVIAIVVIFLFGSYFYEALVEPFVEAWMFMLQTLS